MFKPSRTFFIGLGLAIATPGLSSAEKLPVFKLAEAQADPEHARALLAKMSAGKLSVEPQAVERSGVVGFRAGNTVVEIETASGGIFAANLDQLWNPRLTPRLPGRPEARQQADAFLAEHALLPREEGYVVLSEPVYSESGVAPDAPGAAKTQLDVQVNYQVSLALGNRQVADRRIERQVRIKPRQSGESGRVHRAARRCLERAAQLLVDRDILQHGQVGEERQVLEDDLDAERLGLVRRQLLMGYPIYDDHAAGIGRMHPGENLDQGRLAGAVLPHQAMDLARLDRPVDGVEGDRPPEALSDAGQRQERLRAGVLDWSGNDHSTLMIRGAGRSRLRRTRWCAAQPEAGRLR